jgi:hypothetical protein
VAGEALQGQPPELPPALGSNRAREIVVDGVRIPSLGLDSLIASKETYREQDRLDLMRLRELKT